MTTTNSPKTLALRIAEGKIPVSEALHLAMSLADALRKLHDSGRAHGAVSPSNVALTGAGVELIPVLAPPAAVTPYTAPELLQGKTADARSDIFSFGAIVFEMLTGRRAFDGDGQTALTLALTNSAPPASGSPAVDRLVASCVAKNPAARWQRMQKIIMELKLLTVAARRADAAPVARGSNEAALRAEMQQLEARIAARLAAHEKNVSELQQAATQAVQSLREQLASLGAELTATQQRTTEQVPDIQAIGKQVGAQVEEALQGVTQRVARAEQSVEELRQHSATLQENVAADLHEFEQNLKNQASAVDSARTAMAQTDDLVERVVEALELLQSSVLEQQDDQLGTVN